MGIVIALEIVLVESLHGIGGGEIGIVPVPSHTGKPCLLKTSETVQSSIILYMGCEALLAKIELPRYFGVCGLSEFPAEVYIDEIEP